MAVRAAGLPKNTSVVSCSSSPASRLGGLIDRGEDLQAVRHGLPFASVLFEGLFQIRRLGGFSHFWQRDKNLFSAKYMSFGVS